MITLKYLILYVTFMSVCVRYTTSVYEATESLELLTTYDEELLTTNIPKNGVNDYQTAYVTTINDEVTTTAQAITTTEAQDVTTTVEELTTSMEHIYTTVENTSSKTEKVSTTVKKFVYRTNDLKVNGTKKKPEVQNGKVYAILESFINEPDNNTDNKDDGYFEDMTEEMATVTSEMPTSVTDYEEKNVGEVIATVDTSINFNLTNLTSNEIVRNPQCPNFINSAGFQMDKMPNVWQPVYSDYQDKLPCFKILIRKTLEEEREQYEQWYGNFNDSINWKECYFEIRSGVVKYRKHFLQGGVGDRGVMRNILLAQNKGGDYDLAEETQDQWLMVKNLLFLHDCMTGETVAFARVPSRPCKAVITEALQELGLNMAGDMLLCYY